MEDDGGLLILLFSFLLLFHFSFSFLSATPHKEVYKNRIEVGVEEKKKTQGMRRDLGHEVCGWIIKTYHR